ncbi:MAG: hypothetical protein AAF065_04780 [Verrucomicrobiota bacterium]
MTEANENKDKVENPEDSEKLNQEVGQEASDDKNLPGPYSDSEYGSRSAVTNRHKIRIFGIDFERREFLVYSVTILGFTLATFSVVSFSILEIEWDSKTESWGLKWFYESDDEVGVHVLSLDSAPESEASLEKSSELLGNLLQRYYDLLGQTGRVEISLAHPRTRRGSGNFATQTISGRVAWKFGKVEGEERISIEDIPVDAFGDDRSYAMEALEAFSFRIQELVNESLKN